MTVIKSELKAIILRFVNGAEKNFLSVDLDNSISDEENPTSIAKNYLMPPKNSKAL